MSAITGDVRVTRSGEVSLLRLYLLRALYMIWAVGLAVRVGPRFFPADLSQPVMNTVVNAVLMGLSLTALIGVRYPLKMLPIMLFEIAWKTIWLIAIGWPLWQAGRIEGEAFEVFKAIATMVIFPFVVPWAYVVRHYVKAPGDRWR